MAHRMSNEGLALNFHCVRAFQTYALHFIIVKMGLELELVNILRLEDL